MHLLEQTCPLRAALHRRQPVLQRQLAQLHQLLPPHRRPGQVLQLRGRAHRRKFGRFPVARCEDLPQHGKDDGVEAGDVGDELAWAVRSDGVREEGGQSVQQLVHAGDLAIEVILYKNRDRSLLNGFSF
jgi:hypothetical protein